VLEGKRYKKELRKEERPSSRFDIGFCDALGRRNSMEDDMTIIGRFMSRENMDYAGIFDGHGGNQVAELCATKMHRFVARHITTHDDTAVALKNAFEEMHGQCKNYTEMGATAVVALILENRIWIANAGDARAVISHKSEGAVRLSFDHKPDVPSEKQRVQALGGSVFTLFGCARVNGTLAVSRAIGDEGMHPFVSSEPFVNSIELNGDAQFLILACDGVWDVISDQEAVELVRKCTSVTKAAQTLVQTAFDKNSTDNISVIVIFFQSPEKWGAN
jgi:serine/threonine protein phosphatase PrpC